MIIIRTHATNDIGFGHLIRTCRLADHLKAKNRILFLINTSKSAKRYLELRRYSYQIFKSPLNLQVDPKEIKLVLFDLRCYKREDQELIGYARQNKIKTLQFTDLGLEVQGVDHIIDPSIQKINPYTDNPNAITDVDFFILHSRFRHFYLTPKYYRKKLKKILISLGGATPYRGLRKIIDLLYRYGFQLKVAPGFILKNNQLKILRRLYPKIKFAGNPVTLARSFYECDLAVICAGITAYEACCTGTPALYLYHNKEQKFIADSFAQKGTGISISPLATIDREKLLKSIHTLDQAKRKEMGERGKSFIDGKGVYRIIDFLKKLNIINI